MDEIRCLLDKINDSWLKGRPEDIPSALFGCFHENMMMRGPGSAEMPRGREACIRSYADFVQQAVIRECNLSEPSIDVWGDTAVATYSWDMTYEFGGTTLHETGQDTFVFARSDGRWQAVWRLLLPGS